MKKTRSIESAAQRAVARDAKMRSKTEDGAEMKGVHTTDSFQNFAAKMGIGADTLMSGSTYGFNPITRIRTLLEWIHRGSWLGGVAIDLVADDMTRAGVEFKGQVAPQDTEKIEECVTTLGVWNALHDVIAWARLYGGAIGVILIDGQALNTPLNVDTVGRDQFKGILPLDRWMVEPSLSDVVTELGPFLGMPRFYTVTADGMAIKGRTRIHYSRVIRMEGIRLPYWQRMTENMWGISVLERLYDRMVAFDSATTGAAQLVYKSYLRTYSIDGFRELVSNGGKPLAGMLQAIEFLRRYQSMEGIAIIDAKDKLETSEGRAFGGLSDALVQLGQQLAGALQIPLVRLFGQSPAGLNSSGDSDLRTYYDGILLQQNKTLLVPLTRVYRAIARSEGIVLPDGFGVKFRPLWQLTEEQKANVATAVTGAVTNALEANVITPECAAKELRQSSQITGIFSNITEEDIVAAAQQPPPGSEQVMPGMEGEEGAPLAEEIPDTPEGGEHEVDGADRRRFRHVN